jgi:uncharacterized protein
MFEFWRRFAFDGPPYVHPEDRAHLKDKLGEANRYQDFEKFIHSAAFRPPSVNRLEFALYPVPYMGDLAAAEIIVLLLNPGLEFGDYGAELTHAPFREAMRATIAQDLSNRQFKFIYLDPAFSWHPGFRWWETRLRPIALHLSSHAGLSYSASLRVLATKLAMIELVPYHSGALSVNHSHLQLPSLKYARALAHDLARNPKVTWLVSRQEKQWALPTEGVVRSESMRSISFSLGGKFGKAILQKIGLLQPLPIEPTVTLQPIVDKLVKDFDPDAIYLFGSHARDEAHPDSDFDLMVVVPDDAPPEHTDPRRPHEVLRGIGLATDVLVWRRRHFENRLHIRASLPAMIVDEGRVLYVKRNIDIRTSIESGDGRAFNVA